MAPSHACAALPPCQNDKLLFTAVHQLIRLPRPIAEPWDDVTRPFEDIRNYREEYNVEFRADAEIKNQGHGAVLLSGALLPLCSQLLEVLDE